MSEPLFHLFAAAAKPVAPYSHAVEADGWVFLTGQIPNDPADDAAAISSCRAAGGSWTPSRARSWRPWSTPAAPSRSAR